MKQIVTAAEAYLAQAARHYHGKGKPALVFDTRMHISSLGYTIVADFGDQYGDLPGGDARHQVKLPNPMYYLP